MAEGVISLLLEVVISFAQKEISKVASAKDDLAKLEQELKSIQPILRDAHAKQFASKEIKDWILRLNEVAYDALDVFDLYRIQRHNTDQTHFKPSKVRKFVNCFFKSGTKFHRLREIGNKIEEINGKVSVLYREKDLFGLAPLMMEGSTQLDSMKDTWEARQTTGTIIEPNTVGREKDEELVLKWLLEEPQENEVAVSLMAIVGMGGVGKTTLAKLIYNNIHVKKMFGKCLWICVSERPKLLDLFKKILEEVGDENEKGSNAIVGSNTLSSRIGKHLYEQKFLLVLDDVWDYGWWNELRSLCRGGRSGSKVLVTTRDVGVANAMQFNHLHELKGLNDEQSWQLFVNQALRKGEVDQELDVVKGIGKNIVKKCDGLPLALSTIGGMMRLKERRKYVWETVLSSPIWTWEGPQKNSSIFAAIALSYMNIPFFAKQCLTYCCIFPKDFQMKKDELVRLWIAEGFIPKEEGIDMEVSVERCLEVLVSCNLILVFKNDIYTLHDIVHDFALFIRGEEHVSIDLLKDRNRPSHCRARFFSSQGGRCSFEALGDMKLRAIRWEHIDTFPDSSFTSFTFLRVLDLSNGNFLEMPDSIGDLVLLKYLNLSGTKMLFLPETITKLRELQTLDLSRSHVKKLPDKLSSFGALRHLDITGAGLLEYLPKEIGKLSSLQTLGRFVVGSTERDGRGSSLQELHDLNNLRGHLGIANLERVCSTEECQQARLEMKGNLQSLTLSCATSTIMEFDAEFSKKIEHVFEALQPPPDICVLDIRCYAGIRLPPWRYSTTFCSLTTLYLRDFKFLDFLPSLGHLPKLSILAIEGVHRLTVLDTIFNHVGSQVGFPKLEHLWFRDMLNFEEWRIEAGKQTMPHLRNLGIYDCPKLRKIPFFPTLEELDIIHTPHWEGWAMAKGIELSSMKTIQIHSPCMSLQYLPHCPALEKLKVVGCDELVVLPFSTALEQVLIENCSKACFSLPDTTYQMQRLKHLKIKSSPKLSSLIEKLPGMPQLESLKVEDCLNLTSLPDDLHVRKLKILSLKDLPQLKSVPLSLLESMKRLEELHVGPNLGSVEVQGLLQRFEVGTLRCLTLCGFQDLGIHMFKIEILSMICLQDLVIEDCVQLLSLANLLTEHSLPQLRFLHIGSSRNETHGGVFFSLHGGTLTYSLTINSLEMSNKLSGLVKLRNRVDTLSISLLDGVDALPEWIQEFHQLECLIVVRSDRMTHLPDWLKKFSKLRFFELHALPVLPCLPDELESLNRLEWIHIDSCPNLSSLPCWVPSLPRLKVLFIKGCDILVNLCKKEHLQKLAHIPHLHLG